jgi:hypothetical protein
MQKTFICHRPYREPQAGNNQRGLPKALDQHLRRRHPDVASSSAWLTILPPAAVVQFKSCRRRTVLNRARLSVVPISPFWCPERI